MLEFRSFVAIHDNAVESGGKDAKAIEVPLSMAGQESDQYRLMIPAVHTQVAFGAVRESGSLGYATRALTPLPLHLTAFV